MGCFKLAIASAQLLDMSFLPFDSAQGDKGLLEVTVARGLSVRVGLLCPYREHMCVVFFN